jgi:hypothetical protein
LGAVQADSPNATEQGHCTDESDQMCYADGTDKAMSQRCPGEAESQFDCGNDDYFHPGAGLDPGSYLGSHWNTADSSYLTSAPAISPPLTVTASGPGVLRPGLAGVVRVTGSSSPVVSYSWAASYAPCLPGVKTGSSVTVQCPSWLSGLQTFTLTAKSANGRAAVVRVPVNLGGATATAAVGLSRSATVVAPGGSSTVKATVRYGTAPVRSTVQFYYSSAGRPWTKTGGALDTGTSGNASLVVKPAAAGVSTTYVAVVAGAAGTGWARFAQPVTTVGVYRHLGRASMTAVSGRPDRVSSKLTTSTGIVLKSQRVYIQSRVAGTTTWRAAGYGSTNAAGVVSLTTQPKRGTYYRWYYPGVTSVTGAYSAQAYLKY